jgi:glycine cleavage system pyridoxal-binding protein P
MVSDLTGLPIANASLLDEATAAAEAMAMIFNHVNKGDKITQPKLFVDSNIFAQTKDVLVTRAHPIGIELVEGDYESTTIDNNFFGAILQYPNSKGSIENFDCYKNDDVIFHIDEEVTKTFIGLVGSDALVMSASSFSYIAAILTDAEVYYLPFWHRAKKEWITL